MSQNEEVRIGCQVVCVDVCPVEWGSVNPDFQGRYLKAQKLYVLFVAQLLFPKHVCGLLGLTFFSSLPIYCLFASLWEAEFT